MKSIVTGNMKEIDLLTDSKIKDIKGLMTGLAEQIIQLNNRVSFAENETLKK